MEHIIIYLRLNPLYIVNIYSSISRGQKPACL